MQARAQHCHLTQLQYAMQHQTMPMVYSEPGFSDQQRAHIGKNYEARVYNQQGGAEGVGEGHTGMCTCTECATSNSASVLFSFRVHVDSHHVSRNQIMPSQTEYTKRKPSFGSLPLRALARCFLSGACATGHTTLLLFRSP